MPFRKKKTTAVEVTSAEVTVMAEYEDFEQENRPVINTAMATHIGTREYQQDAAYVCDPVFDENEENLTYGILCDGMGGTAEGERASNEVVLFMANKIATLREPDNIINLQNQDYFPVFLENTAHTANDLILKQNEEFKQGSGTTLLTVLLHGSSLYWLSVGDSRIYIIRGNEIVQTTKDHNYALELQEKVDAGLLSQEEANNDPKKDHLISYIGAPFLEHIDINRSPFQMQYNDIVLLCSDGLTKSLYDDEILEIITQSGSNLSETARLLTVEAFDRSPGALDNTTVVLMQYLGR